MKSVDGEQTPLMKSEGSTPENLNKGDEVKVDDHPGRWILLEAKKLQCNEIADGTKSDAQDIIDVADLIIELEKLIEDKDKHIAILQAKLAEFMK